MSEEELVSVSLGNDYYMGACFFVGPPGDYRVPRSRLERWEAALTAYQDMQEDIEKAMDEQRERVREINAQRPKSAMARAIEEIYAETLMSSLRVPPLLRGPKFKEPE